MTEILINEGTILHNILLEETTRNVSRIKEIQAHAKNLNSLFSGFCSDINTTCRQMFRKLKVDEEEDPTIIFLTKFTIDLLGELSKKLNLVVKKISNETIEPMVQFAESQEQSYRVIIQKSGDMLASIQGNSSFLNELTKNFNLNENLDLSETERNEFKKIYEKEMEKCNERWSEIKEGYQKILKEADSTNSFRCNFTLKMQVRICKLLNKLVNSPNTDETLNGYEELGDENESLSILIKEKIRDRLGTSILLEEKNMEEFDGKNDFAYKERGIIDDFIGMFTSLSNVKDDETKHEKARSLILNNLHWASYFLNRLRVNLHTQIKLPSIKYHEMTTIIKYLFATFVEDDKNESTLYNLLYISYRMSHNSIYVIKELGKHDSFWQDPTLWYRLIEFVKGSRDDNKKGVMGNEKLKKAVRNGISWISAHHKITTEKKIRSEKMITDARVYDIACEMNYYMARLELKEKFIFDFIVEAAKHYGFSTQNTKKLLNFHYFSKLNTVNKLSTNHSKRKKNIEEKYKQISREKMICICVGKCLKYLQASSDLLKLRLVSSLWAKQLKSKISKRFLIEEKDQYYIWKIRINLYSGFSPSILERKIFNKMLIELPDFTEHSDIIVLDAKRSLCWDESLRETLVTILKCFAFYHPNVGYLQGMNYLCENILKISDDQFIVYRIFEYLMNNPFYGMYSANFDGLRIKIYQFMRIVQREKPKLYNHFQTQKLEGEHFLLPWAITLWGEMSGDLCWILWDGFISKGWKWWIKTGLWLLNILQPELLGMNFQEMMKCFSELSTGLLNMDVKELKDFGIDLSKAKDQIDRIPLHCEVLKQIEKEYRIRVNMVNEYIKKLKESDRKKNR